VRERGATAHEISEEIPDVAWAKIDGRRDPDRAGIRRSELAGCTATGSTSTPALSPSVQPASARSTGLLMPLGHRRYTKIVSARIVHSAMSVTFSGLRALLDGARPGGRRVGHHAQPRGAGAVNRTVGEDSWYSADGSRPGGLTGFLPPMLLVGSGER
jgi:hypothetical protein